MINNLLLYDNLITIIIDIFLITN